MSHAEAGPSRARSHTRTASHSRPRDHVARYKDRPQLGHLASWSVSSHKYGYGVDNLRDGNDATYWQSEGPQPHLIDLSFPKRVLISAISILTSHRGDDSYTPSKISVQCGTTVHDLQEIRLCDFHQPDGWQHIAARPEDSSDQEIEGPPISAFHLRIIILANHLNGKDTHLRGLKVFGVPAGSSLLLGSDGAGAGAAAGPSGVGFGGPAAGRDEDEEDDDEDDHEDVDSDGEGAAGPSYGHGHHRPGHGLTRMISTAPGDGTGTSSAEALARKEQRKRERAMRRLLKQGGADRVGYTSRAFKMHECIR